MPQCTAGNSNMKQPAKSAKKKKPKGAPKRPLSAYNIFFRAERERIVLKTGSSQGKIAFQDLAKMVATNWKCLDESYKEQYKLKAEGDTLRYREELRVWKNQQFQLELVREKQSHEEKMNARFPRTVPLESTFELLAGLPEDLNTNSPDLKDTTVEHSVDIVSTNFEAVAKTCTERKDDADPTLQEDGAVQDASKVFYSRSHIKQDQSIQHHQYQAGFTEESGLWNPQKTTSKGEDLKPLAQTLAELNSVVERAYSICAATTALIGTGSIGNDINNDHDHALQTFGMNSQNDFDKVPIDSVCEELDKVCWPSLSSTFNDSDLLELDF